MGRIILKIAKYGILAVILITALLALGSQTRLFKNWLANRLEQLARSNLNAELQLGRISGNLISNIKIDDILLMTQEDTVLYLERLVLQLRPKALLQKRIVFRVVAIDSPLVKLVQSPQRTWNVAGLAPTEPEPAAKDEPFAWQIELDQIQIRGGSIAIQPIEPVPGMPDRIRGIQARLGLRYQDGELRAQLSDLRFELVKPHLTIRQIRCRLRFVQDRLEVPEFSLRTESSRMSGRGAVVFAQKPQFRLEIEATPLDLAELRPFFPELTLRTRPRVAAKLQLAGDTLRWHTTVNLDTSRVTFDGTMNLADSLFAYAGRIELREFRARAWLPELPIDARVNADIELAGRGFDPSTADLDIKMNLRHSQIGQRRISKARIAARLHNNAVLSEIALAGPFGRMVLKAKAQELMPSPAFLLQADFQKLDMHEILQSNSLASSLNGHLVFSGKWSEIDRLSGYLKLNLQPSSVNGLGLDTLFCSAKLQNNEVFIDSLHVNSPIGMLFLAGKMGLEAENDLRFYGELRDLRWARNQLGVDTLQARGFIRGRIHGPADSLAARLDYRFHPLHYNALAVDTLWGQFRGVMIGDSLLGRNQAELRRIRMAGVPLDSARFEAKLHASGGEAMLQFWHPDSILGGVQARLRFDQIATVVIPRAWLQFRQQRWQANNGDMRIEFGDDFYRLQNVHLSSGDQMLRADGVLRLNGEEDLTIDIARLDLATWLKLLRPDADIGGVLNGQIHIGGTAQTPLIDGRLALEQGWFIEFAYDHWLWDIRYRDGRLGWTFNLQRDRDKSLTGEGYLPVNLSLENDGPWLQYDRPIRIQVATGGLDLSFLQAFTSDVRKIRGSFVCDVKIENTLRDPRPLGFLRIINGGFQIPKLGVDYRDFQLVMTVDSSKINLIQCDLASGKGSLEVSGFAEYEREGLQARLKNAELLFAAKRFQVTRHRNIEGVIDGQARLYGDLAEPRFEGTVRVLRSRVYLPAFEESEYLMEETPNLLLSMLQKEASKEETAPVIAGISGEQYLDNLRGSLKIEFPRNTWLRDPEMNVEIEGELDIVKSGPEFEHFGEIRVVRGTYDLYGRRFQIEKGVFNFEGGLEFNPRIEIEARHVFRDVQRQKRKLKLYITGLLFQPKLRFELDGYEIEERDAIAYLLFHRSFYDLTQGERTQLSQENGLLNASTATNILAGLVASQLSRALGRQLNLDVIDLQGEDDWRQATIILGKYLTNDLFISYQRQLQLGQSEEIVPETVILEYEITPFLLLQLTKGDRKSTGFDLIWKIEKR